MVIAGLACAAGCTLFVDLDGLVSSDVPSNDGGKDPPVDSATEASATDGDADANGSTRFCPQVSAVLCNDFDESDAAVPGPWSSYVTDPDVKVEVSSARVRSAPRALILQSTGNGHNANLSSSFAGISGAELAFDLYIESRGSNLTVAWFRVPGLGEVYLQPSDEATTVIAETHEEDGSATVYEKTTTSAMGTGSWIHVSLDVDFPTRTATVSLDGATTKRTLRAPWASVSAFEIHLGILATFNTTLFYDNITIKTR